MLSPPLGADNGPIDLTHLRRMTLGDAALEREVLAIFISQSDHLMGALKKLPAEADALAHTLTGAARAIGASRVADCAAALQCAIRQGGDRQASLHALGEAVADARMAIAAMLQKS